jgi:uncharacterized protein (UPF0333 family)
VKNKKGQATIEYILLIAILVLFVNLGLSHLRDIFYGFNGEQGVLEIIFSRQVNNISNAKWLQ